MNRQIQILLLALSLLTSYTASAKDTFSTNIESVKQYDLAVESLGDEAELSNALYEVYHALTE